MSWVIDHAEVGGSELLVLLMVANHAHPDGSKAFPGNDRLAIECRMSERQVRRLLHQLVAHGHLTVDDSRSFYGTKVYGIAGMQPDKLSGTRPDTQGTSDRTFQASDRTPRVVRPDIAMSPNPSITVREPSLQPSRASEGGGAAIGSWERTDSVLARVVRR